MKSRIALNLAVALLSVVGSSALAQSPPKAKKVVWSVIEVGADAKILDTKEVKPLKKELAANYKQELANWTAEKKAAKKEKRKFETPKPTETKLKLLKGGFKKEEDAKAFLEKYLAKKKKKDGRVRG